MYGYRSVSRSSATGAQGALPTDDAAAGGAGTAVEMTRPHLAGVRDYRDDEDDAFGERDLTSPDTDTPTRRSGGMSLRSAGGAGTRVIPPHVLSNERDGEGQTMRRAGGREEDVDETRGLLDRSPSPVASQRIGATRLGPNADIRIPMDSDGIESVTSSDFEDIEFEPV